ncbi:MAG: DUF1214 domain-containing protein [Flavobacteriaceae bacterium]
MNRFFPMLSAVVLLISCNHSKRTEAGHTEKPEQALAVGAESFIRAETDNMFMQMINNAGGTNAFYHFRTPTPLNRQTVIRMNRDVLYSGGVFDSEKGLKITFPEMPDDRYASVYVIDNDHYVQDVIYKPGNYSVKGNTKFLYVIIRIQVYNAMDSEEIKMVNGLQDRFIVESISAEEFPVFKWNRSQLDSLRTVYNTESEKYTSWEGMMGKRGHVNGKTRHIAAAAAWGLLPEKEATYLNYKPNSVEKSNCYTATYKIPGNTGFWSITVYGDDGYIKTENCLLNNSNVELNEDGTFTVHFGAADVCGDVPNRLDAPEGWNFLMRVYLPGEEVLKGEYTLPDVTTLN